VPIVKLLKISQMKVHKWPIPTTPPVKFSQYHSTPASNPSRIK
jgi:hypothetical protein